MKRSAFAPAAAAAISALTLFASPALAAGSTPGPQAPDSTVTVEAHHRPEVLDWFFDIFPLVDDDDFAQDSQAHADPSPDALPRTNAEVGAAFAVTGLIIMGGSAVLIHRSRRTQTGSRDSAGRSR